MVNRCSHFASSVPDSNWVTGMILTAATIFVVIYREPGASNSCERGTNVAPHGMLGPTALTLKLTVCRDLVGGCGPQGLYSDP